MNGRSKGRKDLESCWKRNLNVVKVSDEMPLKVGGKSHQTKMGRQIADYEKGSAEGK